MLIFASECKNNTLLAGAEESYMLYVMRRHNIIYDALSFENAL